jgi:hypothetical protein
MIILNDAWAVLGDDKARAAYDSKLGAEEALMRDNSASMGQRRSEAPGQPDRTAQERPAREEPTSRQQTENAARHRAEEPSATPERPAPRPSEHKREADAFVDGVVRVCVVIAVGGLIAAVALMKFYKPEDRTADQQTSETSAARRPASEVAFAINRISKRRSRPASMKSGEDVIHRASASHGFI